MTSGKTRNGDNTNNYDNDDDNLVHVVSPIKQQQHQHQHRHEREVEAYKNPTELFQLINFGRWDKAVKRTLSYPHEASIWISNRSDTNGSLKWRYLPLHMVCLQGNPPRTIIRALLDTYPDGARSRDNDGNLPFHYVCAEGCNDPEVLELLIDRHPACLHEMDRYGRTALQIVKQASDNGKIGKETVNRMNNILHWRLMKHVDNRRGVDDEEHRDEISSQDNYSPRHGSEVRYNDNGYRDDTTRHQQQQQKRSPKSSTHHKSSPKGGAGGGGGGSAFSKVRSKSTEYRDRKRYKADVNMENEQLREKIRVLSSQLASEDQAQWKYQSMVVDLEAKLKSKINNEVQSETKMKEMEYKLQSAVIERDKVNQRIAQMTAKNNELETMVNSLTSEKTLLKQTLEEDRKRMAQLEAAKDKAEERYRHQRNNPKKTPLEANLESELNSAKEDIKRLTIVSREAEALRDRIQTLTSNAAEDKNRMTRLTDDLARSETKIDDLETKLRDVRSKSLASLQNMDARLREVQRDKMQLTTKLEEGAYNLARRNKELEAQLSSSRNEMTNLQGNVQKYQLDVESLRLSDTAKSSELRNLNEEVHSLREINLDLTKENNNLRRMNDEQKQEFDAKLMAVQAAVNLQASAFANLQNAPVCSSSSDDTTDYNGCEAASLSSKSNAGNNRSGTTIVHATLHDDDRRIRELKLDNREKSLKIRGIQYENIELKRQVQNLKQEKSVQLAKLDRISEKVKELYSSNVDNNNLEQRLREESEVNDTLRKEVDSLEKKLSLTNHQLTSTTDQLKQLQEQNDNNAAAEMKAHSDMNKIAAFQKKIKELRQIVTKNNTSYNAQVEQMKKKQSSLQQENNTLKERLKEMFHQQFNASKKQQMEQQQPAAAVTDLECKMRELTEDNVELEKRATGLEELANGLMRKNNLYESEIEDLKKKNLQITSNNKSSNNNNTSTATTFDGDTDAESHHWQQKAKDLLRQTTNYEIQVTKLLAEQEELQRKLKDTMKKLQLQQQSQTTSTSDDNVAIGIHQQPVAIASAVDGTTTATTMPEGYWEGRSNELQSLATELMAKTQAYEREIKELEEKLGRSPHDDVMKEELKSHRLSEDNVTELEDKVTALDALNKEYERQIATFTTSNSHQDSSIIDKLQHENATLSSSLQQLQSRCSSYQDKIKLLTSSSDVTKSTAHKQLIDELSSKISRLASALVSLSAMQNQIVQTSLEQERHALNRAADDRAKLVATITKQEEDISKSIKRREEMMKEMAGEETRRVESAEEERRRVLAEAREEDERWKAKSGVERVMIRKAVAKLQKEIELVTSDIAVL